MSKKCLKIFAKLKEKCLKIIALLIDDILLIIGTFFICKGIFMIYKPAGYIALGICLIALAFSIAKKKVIADAYSKLGK